MRTFLMVTVLTAIMLLNFYLNTNHYHPYAGFSLWDYLAGFAVAGTILIALMPLLGPKAVK